MICCRDATRLASKAMDTRLTVRERVGLRLHLLMCEGCKRYRAQLVRLRKIIRDGLECVEALGLPGVDLTPDEAAVMVRLLQRAEAEK